MASLNLRAVILAPLFFAFCGCHPGGSLETADGCCGQGRIPSPSGRPKNILTHDFGLVGQQQTLRHTFSIANPSGQPVAFTREPDIGFPCCVEMEITSDVVPPGGSVEIKIYFQTEGRPGPFDVFIRLYPDSDAVPAHLHFGGVVKAID